MFRTASLTLAMAAIAWLGSQDSAFASHRGGRHSGCCAGDSACACQDHAAPAAAAPQSAANAPSTRRYSYDPSTAAPSDSGGSSARTVTRERFSGTTPRGAQMRSKGDPGRYNF